MSLPSLVNCLASNQIYYPSISIADEGIRYSIYGCTLKLQTGQWVHDLVSVGRVVNCHPNMGTTVLWRWDDESFISFNARFKDFVDRFGYRKPKPIKSPIAQITDQKPLFGNLPDPSSPYFKGEITTFKKRAAKMSKGLCRAEAHQLVMNEYGREWLWSNGYGVGTRSVDLYAPFPSHLFAKGRFLIRSNSGVLNSCIGEGYENKKTSAYHFQRN